MEGVALVTGGARRLGRAACLALAQAGMDVVVHHGHSPAEAEELCGRIRGQGRRAEAVQADLADAEEAASLYERAARALEAPTVLVNNAAVFVKGAVGDTSLENWNGHLDTNLRAPFLVIQALARSVSKGKIVNVSDWRADRPGRAYVAYTVAKAGLTALTRIAARELAPGIQVNALALGPILPPPGGEEEFDRVVCRIPTARAGELAEFTGALLFLLGNDYVTGEVLNVDGGAHLT